MFEEKGTVAVESSIIHLLISAFSKIGSTLPGESWMWTQRAGRMEPWGDRAEHQGRRRLGSALQ